MSRPAATAVLTVNRTRTMDIRRLLTPYWITYPGERYFPLGQGVTAFNEEDAFFLLDEYGYDYHHRAARINLREITSIEELDSNHIVRYMGPMVFRGIWYPCLNIGIDASGRFNRLSLERRSRYSVG